MERLRLGIIGCGGMGQSHIKTAAGMDLIEIPAVADALPENARAAAALAGGSQTYSDYRELLQRDDIQAVVVATPNHLHREVTIAAVEAGKDVLCEKPMAIKLEDCDAMLEAARSCGRKLMVGQVLRLMHPFVDIRKLIASGELGRAISASVMRISGTALASRGDPGNWRRRRDLTGGLLHELHVHELDLLRSLLGEAEQVYARSLNLSNPEYDYDDSNLLVIDFKGGATASLYGSLASGIRRMEGVVICEKGAVDYRWGRTVTASYQRLDDDGPTAMDIEQDQQSGLVNQAESFARWVLEDRKPEVTGWDGRQAIAIAEAAYESARLNAPAKVR